MGEEKQKKRSKKSSRKHPATDHLSEEQKDARNSAQKLYEALRGLGTDEDEIIRIIIGNSNKKLQIIKNQYLIQYRQHLDVDLASNISGKFKDVILALLKERNVFEAELMNRAISSVGEHEKHICEILCTKTGAELADLNEGYQKAYGRSLEVDIENLKDEDENYKGLYLSLVKGERGSNHGYDLEESRELAQKLVDASQGNYIDDKVYSEVLGKTSFPQLVSVFAIFKDISGKDIKEVAEPRSKGSLQKLVLTMIRCVRNKPLYFAEQIHYALSGIGTRDEWLINYIVGRYEIDMPEIKVEYLKTYDETLYRDIKRDASGYYEKVLLNLVGKD